MTHEERIQSEETSDCQQVAKVGDNCNLKTENASNWILRWTPVHSYRHLRLFEDPIKAPQPQSRYSLYVGKDILHWEAAQKYLA